VVEQRICCCRSRCWPEVCDGKDERQRLHLICVFLSEWVVGREFLGTGLSIPVGHEVWRGKVYCTVQYSTVHRVDWSRVLKGTTRGNLEGQVLFACRFIVREYCGKITLRLFHGMRMGGLEKRPQASEI
jgi:hypothetical protein